MIYHPALSYFARDYGLHQISIEEGGKEPSPAHLKELIDLCKAEDVRVIFVQPEFDKRNAETIAQQTGTKVVPINPQLRLGNRNAECSQSSRPGRDKGTNSQTVISEKPMTKPIIEIKTYPPDTTAAMFSMTSTLPSTNGTSSELSVRTEAGRQRL